MTDWRQPYGDGKWGAPLPALTMTASVERCRAAAKGAIRRTNQARPG